VLVISRRRASDGNLMRSSPDQIKSMPGDMVVESGHGQDSTRGDMPQFTHEVLGILGIWPVRSCALPKNQRRHRWWMCRGTGKEGWLEAAHCGGSPAEGLMAWGGDGGPGTLAAKPSSP
jgi:hypothetical protein